MESKELLRLLVPNEISLSFELIEVKDTSSLTELIFEEKQELVPEELKDKDWVLDGYCNPLSLLSFPIKTKPTHLILKRRRWKLKGEAAYYSNEYYFNHPNAIKSFFEVLHKKEKMNKWEQTIFSGFSSLMKYHYHTNL